MQVDTKELRRLINRLYMNTSHQALDDPGATVDQLWKRALAIRKARLNDLYSIQNVEVIARSYR